MWSYSRSVVVTGISNAPKKVAANFFRNPHSPDPDYFAFAPAIFVIAIVLSAVQAIDVFNNVASK
jgi:hypothetical protein